MRLYQYLTETYETSSKEYIGNDIFDIYSNPTPKEISELKKAENRFKGFRVLADLDKKIVYVSNNNLIHLDIMKALKLGVTAESYYKYGKGADRYLTFSTTSDNMKGILESDTFNAWEYERPSDTVLKNLAVLYKKDLSWLSKWFDIREIEGIIERVLLKYT